MTHGESGGVSLNGRDISFMVVSTNLTTPTARIGVASVCLDRKSPRQLLLPFYRRPSSLHFFPPLANVCEGKGNRARQSPRDFHKSDTVSSPDYIHYQDKQNSIANSNFHSDMFVNLHTLNLVRKGKKKLGNINLQTEKKGCSPGWGGLKMGFKGRDRGMNAIPEMTSSNGVSK